VSLDAIDRALIGLLQEDGRLPYSRLARAVGLSEPATRQRVQRLLEDGTIQVVAVTDPLRTGGRIVAMVGVRVEGDAALVAEALAGLPEAIYVVVTSGRFDVLAEVVCEDHRALAALLNEHVRTTPGVRSTESWLELGVYKHAFNYG
jgi:Lrp/AsnC family transcriptional regulator for asnA, asnC and gidA